MRWRRFPKNETDMVHFYFEPWNLTLAYWTREDGIRGDLWAILSALGLIGTDERYTECF